MKSYTIKQLSELSGLNRKEIRKHLIAQTLINEVNSNKYFINEDDLNNWLKNPQTLDENKLHSIFSEENEEEVKENSIYEKDISKIIKSNDWKNAPLNGIKFADFFCGAGGISLGLLMAGYEPVLGIDINETAVETYKRNLGSRFEKLKNLSAEDITKEKVKKEIIKKLKSEKVKLICGGFPCQGFSLSGSRVISDPRNTLYKDMLDIVNKVRPDFIIMENVVGITTIYEGKVLKKIIRDYKKIGYEISWREINAADFEVGQSRKRIIFIGNCVNKKNIFPKKIIDNPVNYVTCGEVIEKYKMMKEDISINHIFSKHSEEMKARLLAVPVGKSLYPNYGDSWKKCPKDKPSCTIKGNHGATNIHYELPRVITPREMAALQSFPDDYIFYGSKHDILVQIGNAVAPYVARAVGIALKEEILKETKEE